MNDFFISRESPKESVPTQKPNRRKTKADMQADEYKQVCDRMQHLRDCRKKKKEDMPKTEPVKVEAPKVEVSEVKVDKIVPEKVEIPKVEIPKVEIPKVEAKKPSEEIKKSFRSAFLDDDFAETKNEIKQMKSMLQTLQSSLQTKKEEPKIEAPKIEAPKIEAPKKQVPQKFIYTGVYGGFKPY